MAEGRLAGCEGFTLVDDGGGAHVAMMGRVVPSATNNQFTDPYLPVRGHITAPDGLFPALSFMYPNYDTYPVGPGAGDSARLARFVDEICRHARERGLRSVVFQYLDPVADPFTETLRAAGFTVVTAAHRAELAIDFKRPDQYLSRMSSHRRRRIRAEMRALSAARIEYTRRPLRDDDEILVSLRIRLAEKYRGAGDPEKERRWFDNVRRCFPAEDVFVICADIDGRTVGFTLFVRTGDRLTALLTGTDYGHPHARYIYFGTCFYAAVPLALDLGIRVIEYGMGSEQAKTARGCNLRPLRWAVRDLAADPPVGPDHLNGSD
ncbi:GNAT family N-acetyltransferase [Micromonospora sp. C95]|uniref:GNAT family N-acetyltransferase n=1 Tax=Micromonospora sp. C95 TaxID=2824882 RepID=UPI001B36BB86|nr:GNAT family N-acetyltransferase [Micromonospora sp. C95]MBQ1023939.1 GNAT family N-acetyltransferase [Micromonospora sp. C95]